MYSNYLSEFSNLVYLIGSKELATEFKRLL
jgi:hypothetical protein